jgi:tetratricopeptide (TPR) repeat protein
MTLDGRSQKRTNVRFIIGVATVLTLVWLPVSARAAHDRADDQARPVAALAGDAAMREGLALVAEHRWADARRAFEQALAWNADLAAAHYNLGVTLAALGRRDEAIAAYREALRRAPAMSEALINLGVELFQRGRADQALSCLQQAVRVAPHAGVTHHNLGVVLQGLGRLDEAVAALERAAALAPENVATLHALADTHYNIGVRHARRHRWIDAVASYRTAVGFRRDLPEAFNGAGVALVHLRQDRQAMPMFEEALRLRPSFAEASYNLARTLVALGRMTEAVEACWAALRAEPHLRQALQLLESLMGSPALSWRAS